MNATLQALYWACQKTQGKLEFAQTISVLPVIID